MEGASSSIIMLVVLIAVFYFMLIRPENKRKKKAQEMRDSLKKGDTITTIGGIVADRRGCRDTIVIETSDDRVRMELTKWAVSTTGVQSSGEEKSSKEEKKEDEVKKTEEIPEAPAEETDASSEEEKKD